jgi:hypothetical protein
MAYIFPVNPFDGQLYPVPAIPGSLQYQWNQALRVWLIYSPLGVQSVTGILPIVVANNTENVVVSIAPATINTAGSLSAADKTKLDNIPADASNGTVRQINTGSGLSGGPITSVGTINLEPASKTSEGGVIIGDNIDVAIDGTISIPAGRFGVSSINIGPGLVGSPSPITSTGTISAALATRLTVGSVRVGNGLNVALDGTLSLGGTLGDVGVLAWGTIAVVPNQIPYQFTVTEGYNISAVNWVADDQPRVRVFFQRPLANSRYGVSLAARVSTFGSSFSKYQDSATINFSFKTVSYIDLLCCVLSTQNNTTTASTTSWNTWNNITEFDVMIVDTAVY